MALIDESSTITMLVNCHEMLSSLMGYEKINNKNNVGRVENFTKTHLLTGNHEFFALVS